MSTIPSTVYCDLVTQAERLLDDKNELATDLNEFIKGAAETHGLHKETFRLALRLRKLDAAKLGDWLRGLDMARVYLKLDEYAGDMLPDQSAETAPKPGQPAKADKLTMSEAYEAFEATLHKSPQPAPTANLSD